MAVDWKGALPLTVLLFVIAILAMQGIYVGDGFVGLLVLASLIVLALPVLNSAGVPAKSVNSWFVRAAVFLVLAAAFTIIPSISDNVSSVAYVISTIGVLLAWLMLFIGGLVALFSVKA